VTDQFSEGGTGRRSIQLCSWFAASIRLQGAVGIRLLLVLAVLTLLLAVPAVLNHEVRKA
jgi:hypothetical protein